MRHIVVIDISPQVEVVGRTTKVTWCHGRSGSETACFVNKAVPLQEYPDLQVMA